MSTGSDQVVLVVQLQGAAGPAPSSPGTGGAPPGPTPPPVPPPLPSQPTTPASQRWWWLPFIQNVPGAAGVGTQIRTGAVAARVGGIAGAAGVGVAFGAAMWAAIRALQIFADRLNVHGRAVDDLANRLAAGPEMEAIKQIQAIRLDLSRMQRAERFAPAVAEILSRRTTAQIIREDLGATVADAIIRTFGPVQRDIQSDLNTLNKAADTLLQKMIGTGLLDSAGEVLSFLLNTVLVPPFVGRLIEWLRSQQDTPEDETLQNFETLLWIMSPDNPANQIYPDRESSMFRATAGDSPQEESL